MVATSASISERYRILAALGFGVLLLAAGLGVAASMTQPASAQLQVGELDATAVNKTVDGVNEASISADLTYQTNVPDAESRVVELKASPSKDDLTAITFDHEGNPDGEGSGTVTLSGSLIDAGVFSTDELAPDMAESKETDVVVAATIRVERAGGDAVERTVTERTTLTLHDSTTLSADVGGSVDVSVSE